MISFTQIWIIGSLSLVLILDETYWKWICVWDMMSVTYWCASSYQFDDKSANLKIVSECDDGAISVLIIQQHFLPKRYQHLHSITQVPDFARFNCKTLRYWNGLPFIQAVYLCILLNRFQQFVWAYSPYKTPKLSFEYSHGVTSDPLVKSVHMSRSWLCRLGIVWERSFHLGNKTMTENLTVSAQQDFGIFSVSAN